MNVTYAGRYRSSPDFRKPIKVFDFFSGCGGTSSGLRAAGMEIVLGLDNDPDAGQTFRSNFPEADFLGVDIRQLPTRYLDRFVASTSEHPLLFSACAPCQPFSKLTRDGVNSGDKRFGLLGRVLSFVKRHRPEFVLVENVPGLRKSSLRQGAFVLFVRTLRNLGYETEHRIVRCQDYGVPQRRARLMLLASRIGRVAFPVPTHGPRRRTSAYSNVRDWIGELPSLAAGETHAAIPNHRAAGLSKLNLKRISATPPGGDLRDLPTELVPDCHRSGFSGYTDVYGRLRWDTPAPALTTRCISYSNGRFGHPDQDRALSVREAACLQTFPAEFVFLGNLNSQARQVGNAVPTLLAQRFGERILEYVAIAINAGQTSSEHPGLESLTPAVVGQNHG